MSQKNGLLDWSTAGATRAAAPHQINGHDQPQEPAPAQMARAGLAHQIERAPGGPPSAVAGRDYLGLARDPRLTRAAQAALEIYGVHSAGAPARHRPTATLARRLCAVTGRARCLLYPTAWAAAYAVLAGVAAPDDVVLLDCRADRQLQAATRTWRHVHRFTHAGLEEIENLIWQARARHHDSNIILFIESRAGASGPDLAGLVDLARAYEATVVLDVSHDFGVSGRHGLGELARVAQQIEPDVVLGSLGQAFAADGAFVLLTAAMTERLGEDSPADRLAGDLSPLQATVALRAADIIFSAEGAQRRRNLLKNVLALRRALQRHGLTVGGRPGPIVPIVVGNEALARAAFRALAKLELPVDLVTYSPPIGDAACLHVQIRPDSNARLAEQAAGLLATGVASARAGAAPCPSAAP